MADHTGNHAEAFLNPAQAADRRFMTGPVGTFGLEDARHDSPPRRRRLLHRGGSFPEIDLIEVCCVVGQAEVAVAGGRS